MRRLLLLLPLLALLACDESDPEWTAAAQKTRAEFLTHDTGQTRECQALGGFARTHWERLRLPVEGFDRTVVIEGFLFQDCAFPPVLSTPALREAPVEGAL